MAKYYCALCRNPMMAEYAKHWHICTECREKNGETLESEVPTTEAPLYSEEIIGDDRAELLKEVKEIKRILNFFKTLSIIGLVAFALYIVIILASTGQ